MDEEMAFDRLVGACPSFLLAHDLDRFVASFEDEDLPDRYVRLSALALHLVAEASAGRLDEVSSVLGAAEEVLADGDADATELVRMGLVEYLQNICSHDDVLVSAHAFEPLLGPRLREAWDEVEEEWRAAGRFAEPVGHVTLAEYGAVIDPDLRRYLQVSKRRLSDGFLVSATDLVRHQTMVARTASSPASSRIPASWLLAVAAALVLLAFLIVF